MEVYENRLASFGDKWPLKNRMFVHRLVAAGFYFKPTKKSPTATHCYLCKREIGDWKVDQFPWTEHQKRVQSLDLPCPLTTLELEESRLSTFVKWPKEKTKFKANPIQLAKAGFYFCPTLESPDLTRCYQCHVALDCWDKSDDPFYEHEKRNPQCAHILQNSGPPYDYHKTFGALRLSLDPKKDSAGWHSNAPETIRSLVAGKPVETNPPKTPKSAKLSRHVGKRSDKRTRKQVDCSIRVETPANFSLAPDSPLDTHKPVEFEEPHPHRHLFNTLTIGQYIEWLVEQQSRDFEAQVCNQVDRLKKLWIALLKIQRDS